MIRASFCLFALLCILNAYALAGTSGISGEWVYYGNREGTVRISATSGILEDGTSGTSYVLREEGGSGVRYVAGQAGPHPGDARKLLRVHEDVLLFLGVKNPILVRKGVRFQTPREKIRGRWHYAAQMNEVFYYDAEFDLDVRKMVEISRSEQGRHVRSEGRPLELLLDAQAELALQAGGVVYHFARLGTEFLVLEGSYATATRNGYKILLERVQASRGAKQAAEKKQRTDGQRKAVKAQAKKRAR